MDDRLRAEVEGCRNEIDNNYRKAMKIVYYLLDKGQLSMEDNKELYMDYSDRDIQHAVDQVAESFEILIRRFNHVVYLVPYEDNEIIGMKMKDLRNIAGSKNTNVTAYLSMYLVTLLLQLFYSGVGERLKTRDFASEKEVVDYATERLEKAASKREVEIEEEVTGYNIVSIKDHWISLKEDDEDRRARNSKYGYVRSVIAFLEKQGLFVKYSSDNIRPTRKLTDLMGHYFLDQKRKETIERLFSEKSIFTED